MNDQANNANAAKAYIPSCLNEPVYTNPVLKSNNPTAMTPQIPQTP